MQLICVIWPDRLPDRGDKLGEHVACSHRKESLKVQYVSYGRSHAADSKGAAYYIPYGDQ